MKTETLAKEKTSMNGYDETIKGRLDVLKTYKLYIDGKFPRTESGRYFKLIGSSGKTIASICRASRKDFRDAVVSSRKAQADWAKRSAYNRGQILYRIAETLEGRKVQFMSDLALSGATEEEATTEVNIAIDRCVYYAGWADKYQQVFSSVNPTEGSYFNFSYPEPTGVVSAFAPEQFGLLGLVSVILPVIIGGNSCIILAAQNHSVTAIDFAEALHASDVPGGVINILTGYRSELLSHFSSHMDVNAVIYTADNNEEIKTLQTNSALNVKRALPWNHFDWMDTSSQNPYLIMDLQEIKTTWHPVGI
ncbi:MAG TPA: aldehyde dehydrogenase family protein [Bacteroidia bacterium]|nr:aldehyde dehydrogenase family protein [Bacteroidia bacterium]